MSNYSNFQSDEQLVHRRDPDLEARLHLERGYGEMRATFRWFCWNRALIHVPAILFYILAGSFFLYFGDLTWGSLNWLLLIPAGILSLALLGIYLVLAVLINHTRVEISSGMLKVKHGPLPYPGNCSIPCSELKEFCTEETKKAGLFLLVPLEGAADWTPKATFYQLRAILKDARKYDLLFGPDDWVIRYLKENMTEQLHLLGYSQAGVPEVVPAGLQVQKGLGGIQVTYRWSSQLFLPLFSMVFTAVSVYFLWPVRDQTIYTRLLMIGLPLLALYGMYWTLATVFNRTTIEITREGVQVRIGPLPWPGNRSFAFASLERLTIVENEHKSDEPAKYELLAALKDGRLLKLWSNPVRERLEYLKQTIEEQQARQTPVF